MSDWGRFNSQFRETERERNERLRKSYARRLAREKDTDTAHTAPIATRPAEPRPHADLALKIALDAGMTRCPHAPANDVPVLCGCSWDRCAYLRERDRPQTAPSAG